MLISQVVKAGTPMQVTVSGKSAKDTIRGIMVQARAGDTIVGTWKVDKQDRISQLMKCNVQGVSLGHFYSRAILPNSWMDGHKCYMIFFTM